MCARLVTVMRGLGDEVAASIKAEMRHVDKTNLEDMANACSKALVCTVHLSLFLL